MTKKNDEQFSFIYSEKEPDIDLDFFFQYPFLIEVNLSFYPHFFIPNSISQCFMIERIDITNTKFSEPPAILFSLPLIRAHPENILFGANQRCTPQLMANILSDCSEFNQGLLKFVAVTGEHCVTSYSPDTTLLDFVYMICPEIQPFIDCLFLVRTIAANKLYIIPENFPLILYHDNEALWSIELRFMPQFITSIITPYISNFIKTRPRSKNFKNANEFLKMNLAQQEIFFLQLLDDPELKNSFWVVLENKQQKIQVTMSSESASIRVSNSSYFVIDKNSIYLSYVSDKVLLVIGNHALVLDPSDVCNILPLFYLNHPKPATLNNSNHYYSYNYIHSFNKSKNQKGVCSKDFLKIATNALSISLEVVRKAQKLYKVSEKELDIELDKLKKVKSKKIPFCAKH